MNTAQQTALAQAKQGNPAAIAALMRKQLAQKEIQVKVSRNGDTLTIALGGAHAPPKTASISFVRNGLANLGIQSIQAVQVRGYQLGVAQAKWIDNINLATQPIESLSNQSPASYKIKRNEEECSVADIHELRQWVLDGIAKSTDYIFNPVLEKWMYLRELGEVEDILKSKNSNNQAKKTTPAYVWIIGSFAALLMTSYVASLFAPSELEIELEQLADEAEASFARVEQAEAENEEVSEKRATENLAMGELMSQFEKNRLDYDVALEKAQRKYQQEVKVSQEQYLKDWETNRYAKAEHNVRLAEAEAKLTEAKVQAGEILKSENEQLLASPLLWDTLDGITDSKGQPIGPDTPLAELEAALEKL